MVIKLMPEGMEVDDSTGGAEDRGLSAWNGPGAGPIIGLEGGVVDRFRSMSIRSKSAPGQLVRQRYGKSFSHSPRRRRSEILLRARYSTFAKPAIIKSL